MIVEPNSKFIFIGDSITDAGTDSSGEGTPWGGPGHGWGYVNLVNAWIASTRPEARIRIINRGKSGNTVRDLAERWQRDVVDLQPQWLSIMIGINDVWRQFDSPLRPETQVALGEYSETLEGLIASVRPSLKGLLLMTPYVIEPNLQDPMRQRMDEYGAVVKDLAQKFDALFIDTQAPFDEVCRHLHPMALAWDRIHPNTTGHMILARSVLGALGLI